VNRDLRRIALTKQLWIQIINDLIYRSLLEPPADFVVSEHSSTELIEHVERAVMGPRAWLPTFDESPTPTKTIVLPVKIIRGYKGKTKVKLVNGGRQIVLAHGNLVEIWDVATKRCLWTRVACPHDFSVDPTEASSRITLAMVLRDRCACITASP
jgi:hypothetical protein